MDAKRQPGRVITFYSYKGGTGRSMALANVAWILACNRKRVLVIDWDLEAPGLHRYFRPFLIDEELRSSTGLIDLIDRYANHAIRPVETENKPAPDWYLEYADFTDYVLSINFDHFPEGGKIDFLPAGRQTSSYAISVNSFHWQNFYDRLGGGGFLEAVKQIACVKYDYILIDSRTGVSDTAGICTVQMPEILVVCFTYNNQSIKGAAAVARSSQEMRAKLVEEKLSAQLLCAADGKAATVDDTPPPYRVFPVPMRVDSGESDRLALRQAFARESFSGLMAHLGSSEIGEYWNTVEVPYKIFYSYEEVLAPFKDEAQDPKTVLAAFVRLTRYLTHPEAIEYRLPIAPEVKQKFLEAFAETPLTVKAKKALAESQRETEEQVLLRGAETVIAGLAEGEKAIAFGVFGRLVKLGRDEEGGGYFPIRASISDFDDNGKSVLAKLARYSLLNVVSEPRSSQQKSATPPDQTVGFADERLLKLWKPLSEWLTAHREFLIWRQQLRAYLADWERSGREHSALLSGRLLTEADLWLLKRAGDLNSAEIGYIRASRDFKPVEDSFRSAPASREATQTSHSDHDFTLQVRPSHRGRWIALAVISVVGIVLATGHFSSNLRGLLTNISVIKETPEQQVKKVSQLIDEAEISSKSGDLAAATDAYRKALVLDSTNIKALLGLGHAYDRVGNFSASSQTYDQAIAINPRNSEVLFNRGWSRLLQRDFNGALSDFNQAIQLDSTNASYYFGRGLAREGLNDIKAAITDYSDAIRWKQEYVEAYLNRARLYEKIGTVRDALADYQSVLTLPATKEDAQVASERITALRGTQTGVGGTGARVFLQYNDRADEKRINDLRKVLAETLRSVAVPAAGLVSVRSAPEVRYFFRDDEKLSQAVKDATEFALAKQGIRVTLKILYRDAKNFPRAKQGTVEVWLPSLTRPSLSSVDRDGGK